MTSTITRTTSGRRSKRWYFDAETGLHHNGQRDVDPTLGRFVQPDPAGLERGVDGYGYAMSRPTSFTDPTGELVPIAAACLLNPTCAAATATLVYGISLSISRCASNAACVDRWKRIALTISANVAAWIRVEQKRAEDAQDGNEQIGGAIDGCLSGSDKCRQECDAANAEQIRVCKMAPTRRAREACYSRANELYGQCLKNCK